jgi:signal transduction histidine kinase
MHLKTKLVLAITALVFLVAGVLSLVYMSQLLHGAVQQTYDTDHTGAEQIWSALDNALRSGLKDQTVDPNNLAQLRALEADAVRNNEALKAAVDSLNSSSLTVYDINIGDGQGSTLLSSDPDNDDKPLPARPNYDQLLAYNTVKLIREVFGAPRVFDVVMPLNRNGQLFATVNVGVRTSLLKALYEPLLQKSLLLMGFALTAALLVAFLLGNLALRPLEKISMQLDYLAPPSEAPNEEKQAHRQDTPERVSTKIEMIGQRMRNVEEVFSALKENLNQILGNLQDGVLLFTGGGRAVLVSESARRFLGREQQTILGRQAWEIFDSSTVLGRELITAFENRTNLVMEEIRTEAGQRIQASVDFIRDEDLHRELGALVTLHDLESAAKIQSELELSRRMAAIGRLTSGVGHEVKNPINAIVVHLELLKAKLSDSGAPAMRHLEVIDAEIHRLDRVVQMLVDFSRPVELKLREQDLRPVIGDVLALAREELSTHNVTLVSRVADEPLMANVDADLLKQAAINVIQNGAQAMPEGGTLEVILEEDRSSPDSEATAASWNGNGPAPAKFAVLRIRDEGPGIPDEIREKIFDLYFTTKSGGSGIGLAMTYRILQLHQGSIDVQSKKGHGTEFQLRIPLTTIDWARRHPLPVNTEFGKGFAG